MDLGDDLGDDVVLRVRSCCRRRCLCLKPCSLDSLGFQLCVPLGLDPLSLKSSCFKPGRLQPLGLSSSGSSSCFCLSSSLALGFQSLSLQPLSFEPLGLKPLSFKPLSVKPLSAWHACSLPLSVGSSSLGFESLLCRHIAYGFEPPLLCHLVADGLVPRQMTRWLHSICH